MPVPLRVYQNSIAMKKNEGSNQTERLLNDVYLIQKPRAVGAVHGTMIGGQRQRHHIPHADFTLDGNHAQLSRPHGQNGALRRIDDGQVTLDGIHAQGWRW